MDVKDAVRTAINDVQELFTSERITNLGLEEVDFDDSSDEWVVTVGFSRPWDYPEYTGALASVLATQPLHAQRSFKFVRISDADGRVKSIKDRDAR